MLLVLISFSCLAVSAMGCGSSVVCGTITRVERRECAFGDPCDSIAIKLDSGVTYALVASIAYAEGDRVCLKRAFEGSKYLIPGES